MAARKEPTSPFDLLGHHVLEINTKFVGIAVCYSEHLHGCNHILVEPSELLASGGVDRAYSFDEQRIQFVKFGPRRSGKIKRASIQLGSRVRHKVNGFEGIAVIRSTWVNHNPTVDIEPTGRGTNGELLEPNRFDEDMVEVIEVGEPQFSDTYKKHKGMSPKPTPEQKKRGTGGPRQAFGEMPYGRS